MSDFVYTIVDEHGYIGTFSTLDKAKELVQKYPNISMIIRRYTLDSNFPKDKAFVNITGSKVRSGGFNLGVPRSL